MIKVFWEYDLDNFYAVTNCNDIWLNPRTIKTTRDLFLTLLHEFLHIAFCKVISGTHTIFDRIIDKVI